MFEKSKRYDILIGIWFQTRRPATRSAFLCSAPDSQGWNLALDNVENPNKIKQTIMAALEKAGFKVSAEEKLTKEGKGKWKFYE